MNFREKLSKKIQAKEKEAAYQLVEANTNYILGLIIKYLEEKEIFELLKGIRIRFRISEAHICAEELTSEVNTKIVKDKICVEHVGKLKDTRTVLLLLERKFKDEGYYIYPEKSAALTDEFIVLIKA